MRKTNYLFLSMLFSVLAIGTEQPAHAQQTLLYSTTGMNGFPAEPSEATCFQKTNGVLSLVPGGSKLNGAPCPSTAVWIWPLIIGTSPATRNVTFIGMGAGVSCHAVSVDTHGLNASDVATTHPFPDDVNFFARNAVVAVPSLGNFYAYCALTSTTKISTVRVP